jgi:hypothetical protein
MLSSCMKSAPHPVQAATNAFSATQPAPPCSSLRKRHAAQGLSRDVSELFFSLSVYSAPSALKPTFRTHPDLSHSATRHHHAHSSPDRADRDPLFSIGCTFFSIHNFPHPLSFLPTTHSLPKTPGVRCPIGSPVPIPATPTESHCFTTISRNPHRITLFHKTPGVGSPFFSGYSAPSALKPPFHTHAEPARSPQPQPVATHSKYWSPVTVVLKSTEKASTQNH